MAHFVNGALYAFKNVLNVCMYERRNVSWMAHTVGTVFCMSTLLNEFILAIILFLFIHHFNLQIVLWEFNFYDYF